MKNTYLFLGITLIYSCNSTKKYASNSKSSSSVQKCIQGDCEYDCWNFKNLELPKIEGCLTRDCRTEFGIKQKKTFNLALYGDSETIISTYEGFFKNGEYHGEGMLLSSDGEKRIGTFKEGYFEGEGTIIYEDGNKYMGETYDDIRQGYGKFYQSGYLVFSGKWYDDEPSYGTGYNSNGTAIHKCYWEDWEPIK